MPDGVSNTSTTTLCIWLAWAQETQHTSCRMASCEHSTEKPSFLTPLFSHEGKACLGACLAPSYPQTQLSPPLAVVSGYVLTVMELKTKLALRLAVVAAVAAADVALGAAAVAAPPPPDMSGWLRVPAAVCFQLDSMAVLLPGVEMVALLSDWVGRDLPSA